MATTVLVTGAAGAVGGMVAATLLDHGEPVRALTHRDDERAERLRRRGAEVVTGDLTNPADVARALDGAGRMFFGMSVSPAYLEATATVATVARDLDVLVAISQLTVSQMTALSTGESHQQRLHWLSERVLDRSGLPVVHVRPTAFLDNPLFTTLAARSIAEDGTIRLPFGTGRTSPVAASDVAAVIAAVLLDPAPYAGRVLELTGPRSQDMRGVAEEFTRALGRTVTYADVPPRAWATEVLARTGLPPYVQEHLVTMARLHRENRYDRLTRTVERVTGRPARSVEEFVAAHATLYTPERDAPDTEAYRQG
jgi:uncharacterized protein YbjT (DUF2867 family)